MSEPFEIIDPIEKFREARDEAGPSNIETAGQRRPPRTGLWLAGATVFLIGALILLHAPSPQVGGQVGTNPLALIPAPAASAHAIDPEAPADQNVTDSVKASAPPSMASNGKFAKADPEETDQVTSETHDEDTQWVKTSLAAKLHSGPSVSTPVLTYYPVGTELRTTGQQSGWVKTIDPATSQQGWIYGIYLSPSQRPAHDAPTQPPLSPKSEQLPTQAELDIPDEAQISAPDPSASKSKGSLNYHDRHRARGAFVIRFGFGRFRVRL